MLADRKTESSSSTLRRASLGCLAAALALTATPPALAQSGSSINAEVRSAAGGKLKAFYKERAYWPLWAQDGTIGPAADRLIDLLETADLDGLDPADYDPERLRELVEEARGGDPEALAKAEMRLSRTFAAYVGDIRRKPSVSMTYLDSELIPERPTEAAVLRTAAVAPSFSEYVANQGWMNPIYAQLRDGLAEYRAHWGKLPEFVLPPGPLLKPGVSGERVRLLRTRLGLPDGTKFDKALAAEVRTFQAAHGLKADGAVGAATIAALNRGSAWYEGMIRVNLERARVLPGSRKRYMIVDAASQRLWMYEDGEVKDTMRVIVGKPEEPTPMLVGMMRYAILNPYWNIPQDLVRRRIVPKVEEGGSLNALGYEALSGWTSDARVVEQSEVDWAAVAAGTQELRVRQLPGKTNAMGKMKFMFPNDLGIYLHDTPEKALFKKDVRQFSSGCIRVEDAARLGEWLFGKPLVAESDAPEQHVALPQPVPVYITYLTAAPTETGIAFREDNYGRDSAPAEQHASR